ncbi:MAG TPA: hypothetical protein VGJ13_10245 [Pseudonocardiaceae bacterium]|jgi:O-antigen/teichoic acid export membrane protein
MSTSTAIGLGILAWVLLAIVLAFSLGYMIQLRDRQRPSRTPTKARLRSVGRPGTAPPQAGSGWDLRNGT